MLYFLIWLGVGLFFGLVTGLLIGYCTSNESIAWQSGYDHAMRNFYRNMAGHDNYFGESNEQK